MKRLAFYMYFYLALSIAVLAAVEINVKNKNLANDTEEGDVKSEEVSEEIRPEDTPCTCGVFLSSQFKKGSKEQPKGEPVLVQEIETPFMNNAIGNKQCTHKCLEEIIKHLPKSGDIICATVDKEEVNREKAFLFVKNHSDKWHATFFSAGREFCCKDNLPYKCPKKNSLL
ncbi:follicle cell protein 3C-1 [Anthonomus grandis grandis]|uniref:follicle cell protein 3C-1 n=1 Tax=Anthonomus grandis grandis TaxID=2921223 RepID=UPI0021667EE0|nr:follicle cell protein 3C-1 [Anthonomus grandis grandis]